ncbi:hypothetical protein ROT00_08635 [Agromyces mediolanus]|uniref:hypothetical protein n=1 Tax=Agromyces mediolanus TaxID=41986 RepID=UPI0038375458
MDEDAPSTDPRRLGPGLLPTPFTAAEIRAASGTGKTIRLLVEEPAGTSFERINRFVDCDAEGATLEQWRVAADGSIDGELDRGRVSWRELQEHAAFPEATTTVREETLELPFGPADCRRYEVRRDADSPAAVFWFALALPGMPARYELPVPGGVLRTTVLEVRAEA